MFVIRTNWHSREVNDRPHERTTTSLLFQRGGGGGDEMHSLRCIGRGLGVRSAACRSIPRCLLIDASSTPNTIMKVDEMMAIELDTTHNAHENYSQREPCQNWSWRLFHPDSPVYCTVRGSTIYQQRFFFLKKKLSASSMFKDVRSWILKFPWSRNPKFCATLPSSSK